MGLIQLLRLVSLRHLWQTPAQTLRAVAAVMVGVGAMVSAQMINHSVAGGVEAKLGAINGRTALRIQAGETGFDDGILDAVRAVPGVEAAVPVLRSSAYVVGSPGEVLTVLGVDLVEEKRVRRYASQGAGGDAVDDPLIFLAQRDSIMLTRLYAERYGLHVDDHIELRTSSGKRTLTIRGLLASEGAAVAFGGNLALMDYQAAQIAFAKPRRLDEIDVVARARTDLGTLAAALRTAVGPGLQVEPPGAEGAELALATRSAGRVFALFSSVVIIVAVFLLYNSVSMAVAQRGREIALLRALGVRRREVIRLVLLEACGIGGVGAIAGALFGVLLAHLLLAAFCTTLNTLFVTNVSTPPLEQVGVDTVGLAMGLGLVTTFLAAWLPARQATRFVPSAAASRGAVIALRQARLPTAWWGVACLGFGGVVLGAALVSENARFATCADAAFLVGFALLAPAVVRLLTPLMARLLRPLGATGRLAVLNVSANPQRSALTVAPLMVAVALAVTVGTLLQSFRASIDSWMEGWVQSDLQLSSVSQDLGRNVLLPASLAEAITTVPGVGKVRRFRLVHVPYEGRRIGIASEDFDPADPRRFGLRFRRGDPASAYARLAGGEAVVVSENFAANFHVAPGDVVRLATPHGIRVLPIAASVVNYDSDQGCILMRRDLFASLFDDERIDFIVVATSTGADPAAVRAEIARRYGEQYQLSMLTTANLRREILARIDEAFLPAQALFVLAVIIGCLGIANALQVILSERVREFGVLRSLGSCRGDVVRLVVAEATVLGLLGALLGVGLGSLLSYMWVVVHVRHFLGWIIAYHFALWGAALGIAAALATAPLASWRAARRAAWIQPVEALAHE